MSILTLVIKGNFNGGFLRYDFGRLIFGGAYTWRGLYMEGLIFGILRYLVNSYLATVVREKVEYERKARTY